MINLDFNEGGNNNPHEEPLPYISKQELDRYAKPCSGHDYEKTPLQMTFLLAMPRTGSYALSKIFNTDYCFAHHEGYDFEVLMDHLGKGMPYQDTNSYALWRDAFESGTHYFCCDQSCGPFLFEKALRCPEIKYWQKARKIDLNVIVLNRGIASSLISLNDVCRSVGLSPDPEEMYKAIRFYKTLIAGTMEALADEMNAMNVLALKGSPYEVSTAIIPGKKDYIGFHHGTLQAMTRITGAAGSVVNLKEYLDDPDEGRDMYKNPYQFFNEQNFTWVGIQSLASIKHEMPREQFLKNYHTMDKVMKRKIKQINEENLKQKLMQEQMMPDFLKNLFSNPPPDLFQ